MIHRLTSGIVLVALLTLCAPLCAAGPPVRLIGEVRVSSDGEEWAQVIKDWIRPEQNSIFQAKYSLYRAMVLGTEAEQDRAIQVAIAGARFYSPEVKTIFLPLLLRGLKSDNFLMRRDAAWDLVFATFARPGKETSAAHQWTSENVAPKQTVCGTGSRAYLPDVWKLGSRDHLGVLWACPPGPRLPPAMLGKGGMPTGGLTPQQYEGNYGFSPSGSKTQQTAKQQQTLLQKALRQQQLQQMLNAQLQQQITSALTKLLTAKDDELAKAFRDNQPLVRLLALQVAAARNRHDDILDRLLDPVLEVRQAARVLLYQLSEGQDFGPAPDANADAQAKAQKQWKEWLAKNKPKPLVPENLDELAKSAPLRSSEVGSGK